MALVARGRLPAEIASSIRRSGGQSRACHRGARTSKQYYLLLLTLMVLVVLSTSIVRQQMSLGVL